MKTGQIKDVKVPLMASIGTTMISLEDLSSLGAGSIVELDRIAGEPIDILAAGEKVGRGEVVVIDENFGIRVTEILKNVERE